MPRPQTKSDLLAEAQAEYESLNRFFETISPEKMVEPGALGEWSVKDVLAHLIEWQRMFFVWYETGLRGENPAVPAAGYNWGKLPALNQKIFEAYRDVPLTEMIDTFHSEHRKTIDLVERLTQEELFTRGLFPWMRNNYLGAYIAANTGSHYRWARTEMRKNLKLEQI
jgi:hypothetical protein